VAFIFIQTMPVQSEWNRCYIIEIVRKSHVTCSFYTLQAACWNWLKRKGMAPYSALFAYRSWTDGWRLSVSRQSSCSSQNYWTDFHEILYYIPTLRSADDVSYCCGLHT
jgi:ribosome modulation factor